MKSFMALICLLSSVATLANSQLFFNNIQYVTEVKSQGKRNACTVFALLSVMEAEQKRLFGESVNYSEQWGQFLASVITPAKAKLGSNMNYNLTGIRRYGLATEHAWNYVPKAWSKTPDNEFRRVCGGLSGKSLTQCTYGQAPERWLSTAADQLNNTPEGRDFLRARDDAQDFKREWNGKITQQVISGESNIKNRLNRGQGLTLEIDIYYSSWAHPSAKKYGMHYERDNFFKGIVTYPERGSVDRKESPKHFARHAVHIIGYDDDIELVYQKKMLDGSTRTFKRKGVYLFKNSWGTSGFGSDFRYKRKRIRGFGMIAKDHVHEHGKVTAVSFAR